MFEGTAKIPKKNLVETFKSLTMHSEESGLETIAFEDLENLLLESGFTLAGSIEVSEVLRSERLFCRSEQFTKVIDMIESNIELRIANTDAHANMCTMSAGSGFKVAMLEGFSGKDVGGAVKVVISFEGNNLNDTTQIPKENDLWRTKAETAAVSVAGRGVITKENLVMASFRFPVRYFPKSQLTEDEKDRLEEEGVDFIVRHYVQNKNAAPSNVN